VRPCLKSIGHWLGFVRSLTLEPMNALAAQKPGLGGSQSGSQHEQISGHTLQHRAKVAAGQRHIKPRTASSGTQASFLSNLRSCRCG
jgi:hypothetical protein